MPVGVACVLAFGLTTALAMTRERVSVCDTRKSASSPATPVSMTATPIPLPVA